jgi:ParB/RepB/Spo0J family partition protein
MPRSLRAAHGVQQRESELQLAREQITYARAGSALLLLPVEEVRPNPSNPRSVLNEESLDELAASIKANQQLQPVVVRRVGEQYELIAGERRWRAVQRAGLTHIWAVERDATDREAYKLALIENLHREDLSQADKVAALDQLAELTEAVGLNQTARELSMSPGWLSQQLAIRRNPRLFPALERGAISFGMADALQRAPASAQQTLLDRVLAAPVPVAAVRGWVEEVRTARRAAESALTGRLVRDDGGRTTTAGNTNPYAALAAQLRALGAPQSPEDQAGLAELMAAVAALGAPHRRRSPSRADESAAAPAAGTTAAG